MSTAATCTRSLAETPGVNWTYLAVGLFADAEAFDVWLAGAAGSEDPMFHAIVEIVSGRAVGVAWFMRTAITSGTATSGSSARSSRRRAS